MSYGSHAQSIYRNGFRPVGRTDPFAATQLGSTPFRPEYLGQWGPFTDAGGYMLHGMGAIVPDQSVVVYQGRWTTTSSLGPMDVIRLVEAALASDGITVRNEQVSANTAAKLGLGSIPFSVTLTLQITNGMGFGDPNDIIADINHEVWVATGLMPLAGSITSVQAPADPSAQSTGQPSISSAPDPNCAAGMPYGVDGSPCPAPPGTVQDWSSWFQQNAMWIGLGLGAVVLVPMILGRR